MIKLAKSFLVRIKRVGRRIAIWWRHFTRHLPPFMRTVWFGTLTAVLVFSSCSYLILQLVLSGRYNLSKDQQALVGKSTVDRKLIKDTDKSIAYNRASEDSPKDIQKVMQLAAAKQDATGKKPYNASLSKDPKQGITFGDSTGDRSFTITPTFNTGTPKLDTEGRAVYPSGGNEKHIYTFKTNGIKSDITINQKPKQNTKQYSYKLNLPNTLEAKMLPNGGIGIYSADPTLFDNLQVGDDKSQQLVDKARQNAKKDTLVFELPAPFITNNQNKKNYDDVNYQLKDGTLTLQVRNLKNQTYPLSIDPTIVVTTTGDFRQKTGDTSNTDYSTDGQINRGTIGSGVLGTRTTQSNLLTSARSNLAAAVYNGYLYTAGGLDLSVSYNDIHYCPINTNGSIGTCTQQTNAFTTTRNSLAMVINNGYLYLIGGLSGASVKQNDIQYCPINSNGSVGTCTQQTNAFTGARYYHTSVVYNGYLYIIGGFTTVEQNDIQYCPLNADGSVGTCTQQTGAFTNARYGHASIVYNGFLYIIGGGTTSVYYNDILYCPINTNGSIGTCTQQSSAFVTARIGHTASSYQGYLYIIGGIDFAGIDSYFDTQTCPLNADGSVGVCIRVQTALNQNRHNHAGFAYNGYIYVFGGYDASNAVFLNDLEYFKINNGLSEAWQSTTNFTTQREWHASAVYNGYMYIIGGCDAANCTTYVSGANSVQYAPINADGTIGTWATTTALTTVTAMSSAVAYNGFLYMVGGCSGASCGTIANSVLYAFICDGTATGGCTAGAANIGKVGTWTATTVLTSALLGVGLAVSNGYMYVTGGCSAGACTTRQNSVLYSLICTATNSGQGGCSGVAGTVGTWNTTTSFSESRYTHRSVANNGYLYVVGGSGSVNAYLADVQYALICTGSNNGQGGCGATAGTVGTWITATPYSTARAHLAVAVYNNNLYVIGGQTGPSTVTADVQYASLSSDGSVGSWYTSPSLTTGRLGHIANASNGILYVAGGWHPLSDTACNGTANNLCSDVQYTHIGVSAKLGTSTQQLTAFTGARTNHTSVAYNGFVYIIGGSTTLGNQNDISYCPINSDGSVGTCTQQTAIFTQTRMLHSSAVYNGYLYIIGGSGGGNQNDIIRCSLNSNGSIGSCTRQTNAFTTARNAHNSVAYKGYLYIVGGSDGVSTYYNDIQYCPINSNGSVGTCTQQTSAFTTARSYFGLTIYNGYIYIVGGKSAASTYQNDIQYCPINSNGSVGTCTQQTSAFLESRRGMTVVAYNGYIYIIGGCNTASGCTNYFNDIQYCPLNANGSSGSCMRQLSAFTTARSGHTSVAYNGYVYVIGSSGGGYGDDIQRIPTQSQSFKSRYERTFDTGSGGNTMNSFTINGTSNCSYTVSYKTAGSNGIYGTTTVLPSVVSGVSQTITSTTTQYLNFVAVLDDSICGGESNVTSITVSYNSVPGAPTLISPSASATAVPLMPEFRVGSTDDSDDYLRYKIEVCSTSNCSSIVRTIDQTSSQTGWTGQSVQGGTAYTGGLPLTQVAIHQYQTPALSASTQYWWRAYAIDPGGTNQWGSASAIGAFTTGVAAPSNTNIGGGTTIYGGTNFSTN